MASQKPIQNHRAVVKKMTTLEILRNHTEEVINQALDLLPSAMRGGRVNRMFFVKENNGEITVDYDVNIGITTSTENTFFIIKNTESFDLADYGVEDFDDIDFRALGWDDKIRDSIVVKIEELETEK